MSAVNYFFYTRDKAAADNLTRNFRAGARTLPNEGRSVVNMFDGKDYQVVLRYKYLRPAHKSVLHDYFAKCYAEYDGYDRDIYLAD